MIETQIDRGITFQNCIGDITIYNIFDAMTTACENPEFNPAAPVIWNLLASTVNITIDQISYLPQEIVDLANSTRPAGKTAWVTKTAFGEATINLLYKQYSWGATWKTFSTVGAAIAWCKAESPRLSLLQQS